MIDSWRLINIDLIIQTFSVLPRQKPPLMQHQHALAALTFPGTINGTRRPVWTEKRSRRRDVRSTTVDTNAGQMFGRVLQTAAWSDDLIRIIMPDKLQKDGLSRWCMHRLSEYSFNTHALQNNGVPGMFPQKLLSTSHLCVLSGEQPPAFCSPTVGLTAQDNSSCFDSLLWLHKSIFTAVLESILYWAFPQSQDRNRQKCVAWPTKGKFARYKTGVADDWRRGNDVDKEVKAWAWKAAKTLTPMVMPMKQ